MIPNKLIIETILLINTNKYEALYRRIHLINLIGLSITKLDE